MNEILIDAREQLKRFEHLIFVTLKYTRTVDVLINGLNLLVSIYDLIIEAFLEQAKEDGKIDNLPPSPALRATRLGKIFPEEEILHQHLKFYSFLKLILNKPYSRRQEFRRHVTFIVKLENATAEVYIDNLENSQKFAHKFFRYAWRTLVGKFDEDEDEVTPSNS
jgi:hypothetical protein